MSKVDLSDKRILVAPLDWGLGHAARSMPIIDQLLDWNADVIIGGDGRSLKLLRREYPKLQVLELPSYDARYTTDSNMVAMTLLLAPKYLAAVYREHQVIEEKVEELGLDLIVSDNRYGLFTDKTPCVIMCHQLALIPPKIFDWATPAVFKIHMSFINRFNELWIPDYEGEENLSGRLAHKFDKANSWRFLGPLSRFQDIDQKAEQTEFREVDIVCVLSGPEPQRTLFEENLMAEARKLKRKVLIVQGKTESYTVKRYRHITIVSFLTSNQLYSVMKRANVVISRSGYSTIMDLNALGKKAIFIPTPGQTEQEYLAKRLAHRNVIVKQDQSSINLQAALEEVDITTGFSKDSTTSLLESQLEDFFIKL